MKTTQQDWNPNPTGKGGFGDNPQNRNPGGWDKSTSISYQYNRLLRMSVEDVKEFTPSTTAELIAKQRITEAWEDNNVTKGGALMVTKEITDRIEGRPAQSVKLDADIADTRPLQGLSAEELRKALAVKRAGNDTSAS